MRRLSRLLTAPTTYPQDGATCNFTIYNGSAKTSAFPAS